MESGITPGCLGLQPVATEDGQLLCILDPKSHFVQRMSRVGMGRIMGVAFDGVSALTCLLEAHPHTRVTENA